MIPIFTRSRWCGTGKTYAATSEACEGIKHYRNTVIAVPSRDLGRAIYQDACSRYPDLKDQINCIMGGVVRRLSFDEREQSVVGRIVEFLKQDPQGCLLIITHEALQRIEHWQNKQEWYLFVDEEVSIACQIEVKLRRRETREAVIPLFRVLPEPGDTGYSVLEAVDQGQLDEIRRHIREDSIDAMFAPLTLRLLSSSHWTMYVNTKQWERFVSGECHKLDVGGLLSHHMLDGFAKVTLLCANLSDTLMYIHWRQNGCKIINDRMTQAHSPVGRRVIIRYLDVEKWSKYLRDKVVEPATTIGEIYLDLCQQAACAHESDIYKHAHITNKDFEEVKCIGEKLSNSPYGLNELRHKTVIAIYSALLPNPWFHDFLLKHISIDDVQLRRSRISQLAYQAGSRGVIRDAKSKEIMMVIVPDRNIAEDLAAMPHWEGASLVPLESPIPLPARRMGRPAKYHSDQERIQAKREQNRLHDLKRRGLPEKCPKSTVAEPPPVPPHVLTDPITGCRITSSHLPELAEIAREAGHQDIAEMRGLDPEGPAGFVSTTFVNQTDRRGVQRKYDTREMLERLYQHQSYEFEEKNHASLIAPVLFDPTMGDGSTQRGNQNAHSARGILLDFEHGTLQPSQFAALLPELQMTTYTSWSHTPEEPRFRVCIPSTCAVPIYVHMVILRMIERRLDELHPQHGLDRTKLNAAAMFFAPTARSVIEVHDGPERKPLNPSAWIAKCPVDIWCREDVGLVHPVPKPPEDQSMVNGDGLVRYALRVWHEEGGSPGGHVKFWSLARRLRDAGWDRFQVEATLRSEYLYAHNPKERLIEIPHVLKSLF